MMTPTVKLSTMLAVLLTASTAMGQYSDSRYRDQIASGGCALDNRSPDVANSSRPTGVDRYRTNDVRPPIDYRSSQIDYRQLYGSPIQRVSEQREENYLPNRNIRFDYPAMREGFQNRYRDMDSSQLHRMNTDYRSRLNSAVEDSFRAPVPGDFRNRGGDFDTQGRGDMFENRYHDTGFRGRLRDPFRLPSYDTDSRTRYRSAPLSRDFNNDSSIENRRRIPLDRVDYSSPVSDSFRGQPSNSDLWNDYAPNPDFRSPPPQDRREFQDRIQPGIDPLIPPLPRRGSGNSEAEQIYQGISARYGNPVNVRSVRSMSGSQALQLYREVNKQTDQRHLEPSSYDLRVRRGLRNIGMALENDVFARAVGISADSFRVDGFRTTLSRIAEQMRVANLQDAENVMQTVMREAQNVPGLGPNIVAFEFTNATIDTLDKFSALEPKEPGRGASLDLLKEETTRSAGLETEMVGVGVEIKTHESGLLIMKALRGGPAAEAGLKSGDIITGINRVSIVGMSMANSVDLMKGNSGSAVQLRIVRNGGSPRNVSLVRRTIQLFTVNDSRILPGTDKVAYLNLSQFGPKSTAEMDQALTQLYNSGMKSLILDLRGNPGGLLNVCVDITNRFLPCGTIVSTKGRLSSDNMLETASFSRTWSTPLVVLVDGDSASASEILAAAVQDNKRGIVVGEKSYGKGTVQTHFPLSSISGNLRLTTARFYSPNGKAMSGQGVTPDVRITDADGPANGDRILNEAVTIAQSQRLRDIAQAARQCRPRTGKREQLQKNSFNQDIFDSISPRTVLR